MFWIPRVAIFAAMALVASGGFSVSSVHAQDCNGNTYLDSVELTQQVITLRSSAAATFLLGPADAAFASAFTPADFTSAQTGSNAVEITPNPAWLDPLPADAAARWIGTVTDAGTVDGDSALYALSFTVDRPSIASATLEFNFAVDNLLGGGPNDGIYINGTAIPCASTGLGFASESTISCATIGSLLVPGTNWLYVNANDVSGPAGVIFSATITVTPGGADVNANNVPDECEADISVTKSDGITSAVPGSTMPNYSIVVTNNGPGAASSVTVTDNFPAALTSPSWTVSTGGGATGDTSNGSGNISRAYNMPVGSTVTFSASSPIDPAATGTLSNTASAASNLTYEINSGNNSANDDDTLTPQADISITKTDGVTSAIPGQDSINYTIVVTNNGPSHAPAVTVTDNFPAALTSVSWTVGTTGTVTGDTSNGSGNISRVYGMAPGSTVTFSVTSPINPAATGTLSNTASVSSTVTDTNSGNDLATDNDTVLTPEVDMTLMKDDGLTTAIPGLSVVYTVIAANPGPSDAPGAVITDTFPAGINAAASTWTAAFAGGAAGPAGGSGNINETFSMPAGSTVTLTVTAPILSSTVGTLTNTASVAPGPGVTERANADNSDADDTIMRPHVALSITKTDGTTQVVPGGLVTYVIVVANAGPSDANGAIVTDVLPAILLTPSWTAGGTGGSTGATSGSGGIAEVVNVTAGGTWTYIVTATLDPAERGYLINSASVNRQAGATEFVLANNTATDVDQIVPPVQKLLAGDYAAGDQFGFSVDLELDTLVIGAPMEDDGALNSGAAYVFVRENGVWVQQARLKAPDPYDTANFGNDVAISGDTVVIGANYDRLYKGAAYVFVRSGSTWSHQAKLINTPQGNNERFGNAVAIDGDTIAVGCALGDFAGTNSGQVAIFTRTGSVWTLRLNLVAGDTGASDNFGHALDLDGGTLAIGAPGDVVLASASGSAYVYTGAGASWSLQQKLWALDLPVAGDNFGSAVSLRGDRLIVGARRDDGAATDHGSAYVYQRSGVAWSLMNKLVAADGARDDHFGNGVSIYEEYALAGAPDDDASIGFEDQGSAYRFRESGAWALDVKNTAFDGRGLDYYGFDLSLYDDTYAVGAARWDPPGASSAGSVYVYVIPPVYPTPTPIAPVEVFFSEYVEGSGANQSLEIYNNTGASVDLAAGAYTVDFYFDGSVAAGNTLALSGVIASGDVFVLAAPSADPDVLFEADQIMTGSVFDGNDAIVLRRAGLVVDAIGQVGFDPGVEWGTGLVSTANNTLRRKPFVCAGDPVETDPFNPAVEWDGFAQNSFVGLGSHAVTCLPVTPTPSPSASPTPPPTASPTPSPTASPTSSPTSSPTPSPSPTASPTVSPTASPTASSTPSPTVSPSPTLSPTPSPTPPSGCTTVVHQESFEYGLNGWVIDNGSGANAGLWRRTNQCEALLSGHAGAYAVGYAADASCNFDTGFANAGTLTSPVINIAGVAPVQLSFAHYLGVERMDFFDRCTVEVSTDLAGWQVVASKNGALGGVSLTNPNGAWEEVSIDISAFTLGASTLQIRFTFDTLDDFSNALPGWYVDDIAVCDTD